MISRKFTKDAATLDTIIGIRTSSSNEIKNTKKDTVLATSVRTVSSSPYADIGATDPRVSSVRIEDVKKSKNMDDDFFTKKIVFKNQTFDDSNFNADKPLPTKEKIIEPEKIVLNNARINVLSEFNNL